LNSIKHSSRSIRKSVSKVVAFLQTFLQSSPEDYRASVCLQVLVCRSRELAISITCNHISPLDLSTSFTAAIQTAAFQTAAFKRSRSKGRARALVSRQCHIGQHQMRKSPDSWYDQFDSLSVTAAIIMPSARSWAQSHARILCVK